jgi:DNA-binding transcriptional LysR family regulator
MIMIDPFFDGIPEFTMVAQVQSFTAAALQLGVTSSAVGKSVSRLENRLGVKLLHRTTRKLTLTHEGEMYLASCQRVMEELRGTESFLATGRTEPRGRVRIDLPAAFGRRHIVPLLNKLARQYKGLDLTITFTERKVDMVNEGIDLAVRIGDLKDDPELVARRLGDQSLVICAAPSYLQEHSAPSDKHDLLVHDCIIGWRKGLRAQWLMRDHKGQISRQYVNVRHELGDGEMILEATLAGCGLAQLPTWLVAEYLESGDLVTVLDECAGARMPINVIWPHTRHIQPKVRIIVDELIKLAEQQAELFLYAPR